MVLDVEALDPFEDRSWCLVFRAESDTVFGLDLERMKEALCYCLSQQFLFLGRSRPLDNSTKQLSVVGKVDVQKGDRGLTFRAKVATLLSLLHLSFFLVFIPVFIRTNQKIVVSS